MVSWKKDIYYEDKPMCLAIPARIESMPNEETAIVDLGGVRKEVSLALIDDVAVGDYVIVHVGFALNKMDPQEAEKTLALFAEMGAAVAAQDEAAGNPA